jgi:hypothetical protein
MDLSEHVLPQAELTVTTGAQNVFVTNSASLMPREEAKSDFVRSLNSLATGEAFDGSAFCHACFEMASVWALQQTLDSWSKTATSTTSNSLTAKVKSKWQRVCCSNPSANNL